MKNNPFEIFKNWLQEAQNNKNIIEPTAMCLATVDEQNRPSNRMVLLKTFDERGFCFFTNLNSRKAGEIAKNKNAAICFYWGILGKQTRIEGVLEGVSKKEADDYFVSRRRESKIGAWASKQSSKIENEGDLEKRIKEFKEKFKNKDVPRPEFWSGFRLIPNKIEFWQEGDFRIHRRDLFSKDVNGNWVSKILYP